MATMKGLMGVDANPVMQNHPSGRPDPNAQETTGLLWKRKKPTYVPRQDTVLSSIGNSDTLG